MLIIETVLSSHRKLGDGLFLQSCAEVAQLYPKIKYENIIIDNCCMQVHQHSFSPLIGSSLINHLL